MDARPGAQFTLNVETLKKCREQMGLTLDDVSKKVGTIEAIENGKKRPTFKQLATLGALYEVPDWVFIHEELPEEYRYESRPTFRRFKEHKTLRTDKKLPKLIARVERLRDFLFELAEDIGHPITPFRELALDIKNLSIEQAAAETRTWLGMPSEGFLQFSDLKELLEKKSIFVFLTSKYPDWSNQKNKSFRGFCIPHPRLPIIIINDSDSNKAQSFTLMHELGHLLNKELALTSWEDRETSQEEKWCDSFAGKVLLPKEKLKRVVVSNFKDLTRAALAFKLSPYALLVRLHQEGEITQEKYDALKEDLQKEYEKQQKKLKAQQGGPPRDRPREIRNQFGNLFLNIVLTAFHYKEISLHKASKILDARVDHVWELAQ